MAYASWWKEVERRFKNLASDGLDDPEITRSILSQQEEIVRILAEMVPYPSYHSQKAYEKAYHRNPVRRGKKRVPASIKILGLGWPCSLDDLKNRWRALAKEHHPDKGGKADEFIYFKQAYEAAMRVLEASA
jgi:hypothetical protein